MTEIWKDTIQDADYQVSNLGKIYSTKSDMILKCNGLRSGYKYFGNGKKSFKIHRVVAMAFIKNDEPKIKTFVNHKDGNKLNNHLDNLEWTTPSKNVQHAVDTGLITITKRRVHQISILTGEIIATFESLKEAKEKTDVSDTGIAKCCKGSRQTAGGYKWEFADKNPNEDAVDLTDFVQVKGFINYLIANDGRVYSKSFKKLMKHHMNADGYKTIQLCENKVKKDYLVHRLVAMHFIKNDDPDNKITVNHKDKIRTNNNVSNLEWMTHSENNLHKNQKVKK